MLEEERDEIEGIVNGLIERAKRASYEYKKLTQEQVDEIVKKMAMAGLDNHMRLAKMTVDETGRGIYEDKITYIDDLSLRSNAAFSKLINFKEIKLNDISHKLDLVSPLSVLKRGFAVCKNQDGYVIKEASFVKPGDTVNVTLSKGELKTQVINRVKSGE